jgi:hypothetical protein
MLYEIAAPSSSLSSDTGNIKKTSDHVRVMAMSLIKDCIKEKIEILTSQAAVTHALDFVEKTKQQVKDQFNQDMQRLLEQDRVDIAAAAINNTMENNPEIQSYAPTISRVTSSSSSSEQDQEEEEFVEQEDFEDAEEEEPEQEGQ